MKKPNFNPEWPKSWKESYEYDKLEVFGELDQQSLGYAYAYSRRCEQTLQAVQKHVQKGSRILDVAAAQGNFTLSLAEMGYEVTWNDLRSELADYVKLKHEFGEVHFKAGNCFELDFGNLFDAVLITEIIEHVAHPDRFLRKSSSLVKPGGYIIMTTPNGEYFRYGYPKFSECRDPSQYESEQFGPDADGHIFLLHTEEIHSLAVHAGLQVVENKTYTNFLTNGHVKTHKILPLISKGIVDAIEALTSIGNGIPLKRLNTNMLTVFQRKE